MVHYQEPVTGTRVKGTVLLFHGWNLYADYGWEAKGKGYDPYGIYYKVQTIKTLLDAGYIVVTPNAQKPAGYWDTNQAPYNTANLNKWNDSPDNDLVLALLAAVGQGRFGQGAKLDSVHAVGFSSGGYMASRMAYSYPGAFRSITVASASYFFCGGSYCPSSVAAKLKDLTKRHPPTLFLHGTQDSLVPASTSETYHNELLSAKVTTKRVTGQGLDHTWIPGAPKEIVAWVNAHS